MKSISLLRPTNLGISPASILFLAAVVFSTAAVSETYIEKKARFLKESAESNGYTDVRLSVPVVSDELASLGKFFFESKDLSYSGEIACVDCHLDEFSGADGIPISIGLNGKGKGIERLRSGGKVIPRNSLTLWGRGDEDFKSFFWDGRVEHRNGELYSQFGDDLPSKNLLEVAVHLPVLELGEMVRQDKFIENSRNEDVASASQVLDRIAANAAQANPEKADILKKALGIRQEDDLKFSHLAKAIAEFIKRDFAVANHRFNRFVYENEPISDDELEGGLIFYGKGKCSVCHAGRHFSDFSYHAVATGQVGQGKNGFGVDYGRFNITHDPSDLYKFRTPPLVDVADTHPYGHSGGEIDLSKVIVDHFDPLRYLDSGDMSAESRVNLLQVLKASGGGVDIPYLSDDEVEKIVQFLKMLSMS